MRTPTVFLLTLLAACTPDWSVEGGLASRWIDVKARGTDVVPIFLVTPSDGQGPVAAPSGVVLVPGGRVEPERYEWLAKGLAARGRAVAMPSFPLDLALLRADDVQVARRVLVQGHGASGTPPLAPTDRLVAMGHSLGGVVAAGAAVDGGFASLVLLASYPAEGDRVEALTLPMLSVAGELDCDTLLEEAQAGFDRFTGPRLFAELEGLTHYGFTDTSADDRERGCAPRIELEDAHERILEIVDLFLRAQLDGDAHARARLEAGLEGVRLEEVR